MAEDYTLLKLFNEIIKELKSIDLAWFTTFNLDPLLVENYLVPQLLNADKPRDIYDYEALTNQYASSKIDIRFFYDPNALITTSPKRTSIPINPVSMERFGKRYKKGIFHPKVWYFQSKRDPDNGINDVRAFLVVTSANMTFSGWAENREAFIVREVRDVNNLRKLQNFFTLTFNATGFESGLDSKYVAERISPLAETIGGHEDGESFDWEFLFNDPGAQSLFIKTLLTRGVTKPAELSVWSPYWAEDIPSLLHSVIDAGEIQKNMEIRLFPSFNSANQPRFSQKQVEAITNNKFIGRIYRDDEYGKVDRFSHAKIWRTDHAFAIGSWNCTCAALDLPSEKGSVVTNMEAGILVSPSQTKYMPKLNKKLKPISIDVLKAISENELSDETAISERMPPVQVYFDWKERLYSFRWPPDSGEFSPEDWLISLPGVEEKNVKDILENPLPLSPRKVGALVRSRLCTVKPKNNKDLVFYLYVIENNIEGNRQSLRYTDLDELLLHLQAHGTSGNLEQTGGGTINVPEKDIRYTDEEAYMDGSLDERKDVASSYFVMFRAFYTKAREIKEAKDVETFRRSVEISPGNLFEIWDHIQAEIYRKDSDKEFREQLNIYCYFLVREFLELFSLGSSKAVGLTGFKKNSPWYNYLTDMKNEVESALEKIETIVIYDGTDKSEAKAGIEFINTVYGEG